MAGQEHSYKRAQILLDETSQTFPAVAEADERARA